MQRSWLLGGGLVAILAVGAWIVQAQEPPDKEQKAKIKNQLMKKKLESAQKVLEGAALLDFRTIERYAEELIQISNQAEWRVVPTPEYSRYSEDFRRNCDALKVAAKKKNGDAVAMAYVKMSMNCFDCHKYIREVKITKIDANDAEKIGALLKQPSLTSTK